MATVRAIYRLNGGEVLKIAKQHPVTFRFQTFSDRDTTVFGIVDDPLLPDGDALMDTDLVRRQLGFAKIFSTPVTIRNATQVEIDAWAGHATGDQNTWDAILAKRYFEDDPVFRKLMVAFADILKDEINILRSQHSLADRTLAQLKTAMINRISSND